MQLELPSREFGVTLLGQEVFNEVPPLIRVYWPTHQTCASDPGGFSTLAMDTATRVNSFTMTLSRTSVAKDVGAGLVMECRNLDARLLLRSTDGRNILWSAQQTCRMICPYVNVSPFLFNPRVLANTRLAHETWAGSRRWRWTLRHVGILWLESGETLATPDPRPGNSSQRYRGHGKSTVERDVVRVHNRNKRREVHSALR